MQEILKYFIPSGIVGSIVLYLWSKYVRLRPKVSLNVKWGGATLDTHGNDSIELRYSPKLILHNDSNFIARRIKLHRSSGIAHWQFLGELPTRIEPDGKFVWDFTIQTIQSRTSLISLFGEAAAKAGPTQQFFPHALGNVVLILSYDNEKDTRFYTRFTLDGGNGKSEYLWRKPNEE
jgi:hypothetical protein